MHVLNNNENAEKQNAKARSCFSKKYKDFILQCFRNVQADCKFCVTKTVLLYMYTSVEFVFHLVSQ